MNHEISDNDLELIQKLMDEDDIFVEEELNRTIEEEDDELKRAIEESIKISNFKNIDFNETQNSTKKFVLPDINLPDRFDNLYDESINMYYGSKKTNNIENLILDKNGKEIQVKFKFSNNKYDPFSLNITDSIPYCHLLDYLRYKLDLKNNRMTLFIGNRQLKDDEYLDTKICELNILNRSLFTIRLEDEYE